MIVAASQEVVKIMARLLMMVLVGMGILAGVVPAAVADDFEGLIHPSEIVKLSSQVPGILEEVLVERGDVVSKGQTVARLKSGLERASVEIARTNVEFLKRKTERNVEMGRKKLISANELDELETEQKKAEHQFEEAQERLKTKTILSTIDGVVAERMLAPGDYVGEAPILKLARLDPLKVEVIVPVRRFGAIKTGMKAEVRPEQPVGGVYAGKVTIVDKVIDAASNTFIVRVDIPNPSLKIPSGLRCRVRFIK
jgi:RND family efflux transporter MFP subunit